MDEGQLPQRYEFTEADQERLAVIEEKKNRTDDEDFLLEVVGKLCISLMLAGELAEAQIKAVS
jgi:hypothetical protein